MSAKDSSTTSTKPETSQLSSSSKSINTIASLNQQILNSKQKQQDNLKRLQEAELELESLENLISNSKKSTTTKSSNSTQSNSNSNTTSPTCSVLNLNPNKRVPHSYYLFSFKGAADFLKLSRDLVESDDEILASFQEVRLYDDTDPFYQAKIRGAILKIASCRYYKNKELAHYVEVILQQEATAHIYNLNMIDMDQDLIESVSSTSKSFPNLFSTLKTDALLPQRTTRPTIGSNVQGKGVKLINPLTFEVVELEEALEFLQVEPNSTIQELSEAIEKQKGRCLFGNSTLIPKFNGSIVTACLNRSKPSYFRPHLEKILLDEIEAYFNTLTLPEGLTSKNYISGITRGSKALVIIEVETFRKACQILKVNEHASTQEILTAFESIDPRKNYHCCGALIRICYSKLHVKLLSKSIRLILLLETLAYLHELNFPTQNISCINMLIPELRRLEHISAFEASRLEKELEEKNEQCRLLKVELESRKSKIEKQNVKLESVKSIELDKATNKLEELEVLKVGLKEKLNTLKTTQLKEKEIEEEKARLAKPKKVINRVIQTDKIPIPIEPNLIPVNLIPLLGELSEDLSARYMENFHVLLAIREHLGFPPINLPIRMEKDGGRRRSN